jgi:hypothetical protein
MDFFTRRGCEVANLCAACGVGRSELFERVPIGLPAELMRWRLNRAGRSVVSDKARQFCIHWETILFQINSFFVYPQRNRDLVHSLKGPVAPQCG